MQSKYEPGSNQGPEFLSGKPMLQLLVIGLLFLAAFAVRLHHVTSPPLEFQPTRQYMLAHNTRGYYYDNLESVSETKKELARINKERMGFEIEVPILDHIIAFGYRVIGGEHLWFPRVVSMVFWMLGGVFLYMIAAKLFSSGAALFSTVFYLFLPFGILAGRSFQPDPLMLMLLLMSIYLILKYYDRPSLSKLASATAVSAIAMLVKPYCIFLIFGAFVSVAIYRHGIKKFFTDRDFLIFIFLSPVPGAAYYISGLLIHGSFLQEHAQATFLPHLLLRAYFWKDWLAMALHVIGLISLAGALIGLFVMKKGPQKVLLTGLWTGYIVFGLFFTFHIHSHDYYQLQFIPVVALSLGPLGAMTVSRLFSSKKYLPVLLVFFAVLLYGIGTLVSGPDRNNHNRFPKIFSYVVGIPPEFYSFIKDDFEKELRIWKEIGDIVKHSSNTLFLTSDFGRSLTYHGELSGLPWPTSISFQERADRGIEILKKEDFFNPGYFTIRSHGKFIRYTPDFFIIVDFKEYARQPELKEILTANFPVIAQNSDYLIFDTRRMSEFKQIEKK